MEKMASALGRKGPPAPALAPSDDLPPECWQALLDDARADARSPPGALQLTEIPVSVENQIRTYSWCNPLRIGRQRMRPALFTVRDRGASLSKAKCVRVSL
jgi:hypothetical protein